MKYRKEFFKAFIVIFTVMLFAGFACKKKQLPPLKVSVSVRSRPEKVNVSLISHKNSQFGITPRKRKLSPGEYIFEFTKPGYRTSWKKVVCKKGEPVNVDINLTQLHASVIIESEPDGAQVFKDKVAIGSTPVMIKDLTLGLHSFVIKKNTYSPREVKVEIENERPQLIKVNLNSNVGVLQVRSVPSGAKIFLNETPRGQTPSIVKVEEGKYALKVEKDGYVPFEQNIILSKGQTIKVAPRLNIKLASLDIETEPSGAAISVNGRKYNDAPVSLEGMQPGTYVVEAVLPNYDICKREISVAPGQKASVLLKLDSNMCGMDLIVNPPGVTIYIDGKKRGVTKPGEIKGESKVFEVRNLPSGKHSVILAHKRGKPSQIKFSLKIKKGEIKRKGPLFMWIEDTYIKLKSGRELTGRISYENEDEIVFEISPKIKVRYDRKEISILRRLKNSE